MSDQFNFEEIHALDRCRQRIEADKSRNLCSAGLMLGCGTASVIVLLSLGFGGYYAYYAWDGSKHAKKKEKEDADLRAQLADTEENQRTVKNMKKQQEQEAKRKEQDRQQRIHDDQIRQDRIQENIDKDLKKIDADERARRLGSLSKGEYLQAKRALELVKMRGQDGFERLSPDIIYRASLIDPDLIAEMQRIAGERRLKKN